MDNGAPTRKHIRCPLCGWASYGGSKNAKHACDAMPQTLTGRRQSPPEAVRLRIMEGDADGAHYEFRKWQVAAGLIPGPDGNTRATLLNCPFCGHVGLTAEKMREHSCTLTHPGAVNMPRRLPAVVSGAIIAGLPAQAKRLMKEITDAEQEDIRARVAEFQREQAAEKLAKEAREAGSVPTSLLASAGIPALVAYASALARRERVRVKLGFENASGEFDFMEFAPGASTAPALTSAGLIAKASTGQAVQLLVQPVPVVAAPQMPVPVVKHERREEHLPLPAQSLNGPADFGKWLARLRKRARLSQPALGRRISKQLGRHFAHSNLAGWELGGRMANADLLPALADALGITLDELLRGKPATQGSEAKPMASPIVTHQAEPVREAA